MQNVSKPFGEKATGLLKGLFQSARVRLTVVYVLIVAGLLLVSSASLYSAFASKNTRRFDRIRPRTAIVTPEGVMVVGPAEVRQDLLDSIIAVDIVLLMVAGFFSYYLAGYTLAPIQDAYDSQRKFLSDASHELRTPLAILQAGLENQLAEVNHPKEKEQLQSHLEEVSRMGRLVADLLLLSRFDEGASVRYPRSPLDLSEMLKKIAQRFMPLAEQKHIQLTVPAVESLMVIAHPDLVQQALANIVQNALTYTNAQGRITVSLEKDAALATVVVEDTGIGIAPEDVQKIFERFHRAEKSRNRDTGGSGLGLSIVESIMKYLDGTVDIQSTPGVGTRVSLSFPLSRSS